MKKVLLFSLILLLVLVKGISQHDPNHHDDHTSIQPHRISLFTGYALITEAVSESAEKEAKIIPALGFDYDYWFSHKFAVGIKTLLELNSYVVEQSHEETLEREFAFVIATIAIWEPVTGWALFAGPGVELEKHHNFFLIKVGTDVAKTFEQGWSVGITVDYDFKEVNSSLSFGITVSKRLGAK